MSVNDRRTVRDLRALRRRRRLGDLEWFDIAYRVYLFALGGLIATIVASDAISSVVPDDVTTDEILSRWPSTLGLLIVGAVAIGLRSGSEGGPIAVEAADVRHLLLSPVSRQMILRRPIGQRMRSIAFGLAVVAAVIGQLVGREVEGSRGAWAAACAVFGALVGLLYVASAMYAHAARLPAWGATLIAAVLVGWQSWAVWAVWTSDPDAPDIFGPADRLGGVALWGIETRAAEIAAVVVALAVSAGAIALGGRLRIEPLARRAGLVSQLKFAATVQDLRTVVLLRRQLRAEHLRPRPWGAPRPRPVPAEAIRGAFRRAPQAAESPGLARLVHRRGVWSLRRLPASRLARIAVLAALAGVLGSLTISSSPIFCLGVVATLFVLGLECVEPLSQEVDRPDLTDGVPADRGWLYAHHLVAPSALLAVAALVGATAAALFEPTHAAAAFALAVPVGVAGATGSVVATVRDAPQPAIVAETTVTGAPRDVDSPLVPPEFAGISNAYGSFMPVVVSGLSVVPILAMRAEPSSSTAVRSAVGAALVALFLVVWIRRRDRWSTALRRFFIAGRAAT